MKMLDSFESLLRAAREQPVPQRFLLVFVRVELPDDVNPEQIRRHAAGQGGALVPVMYADKGEYELVDFKSLIAEAQLTSRNLGQGAPGDWNMVVIGCLGGHAASEPSPEQVEKALNDLVRTIRTGRSLSHLVAFDRKGQPVVFQ